MASMGWSVEEIALKAKNIRENIIRMLLAAGFGHSASPLGMADVFAVLYFSVLSYDVDNPSWKNRDRLILSCGHICPVLYATLAEVGFLPIQELSTYGKLGSRLQGHPSRVDLPLLETSSGPLGQGISQAIGMAIALREDNNPAHVYCVMSDGEHNEGQVWEALLLANKFKLSNLTVILDRNNIQIGGYTNTILPLEPLREKYESFGWHVMEVDGHSIPALIEVFETHRSIQEKPVCILAHTIPGKGVDFMEQKYEWHGKPPTEEQAYEALMELRTLQGKITQD